MEKTFRTSHLLKLLKFFDFAGAPLDSCLRKYFREHRSIGSKDRKFIAEEIYKMIRWLGLIDHFCSAPHSWEKRYDILQQTNLSQSIQDPSIPLHQRASCPKFLFSLLTKHFGEKKAFALCSINNTKAPLTLRVNEGKITREELFQKWDKKFSISRTRHSELGIYFNEKINFYNLEEFKNGLFEVQDEGSQLIAALVAAKPKDQILDYCSGSGGKTLAFAPKLKGQGQIYLHDIRTRPLIEAKKRLKRAGVENAQILPFDAPHKEKLKGKMDWVMVDVPCSGSGTYRRNPDLKWKFSEKMLEGLIQEQRKIFQEALAYLHPTGKIVYATCSILPEENSEQIFYFQQRHQMKQISSPFSSLPEKSAMDGFFAAALEF